MLSTRWPARPDFRKQMLGWHAHGHVFGMQKMTHVVLIFFEDLK